LFSVPSILQNGSRPPNSQTGGIADRPWVFDMLATSIAYTFTGEGEDRWHGRSHERRQSLERARGIVRARLELVRANDTMKGLQMAASLG
jgi:hypothetical protein